MVKARKRFRPRGLNLLSLVDRPHLHQVEQGPSRFEQPSHVQVQEALQNEAPRYHLRVTVVEYRQQDAFAAVSQSCGKPLVLDLWKRQHRGERKRAVRNNFVTLNLWWQSASWRATSQESPASPFVCRQPPPDKADDGDIDPGSLCVRRLGSRAAHPRTPLKNRATPERLIECREQRAAARRIQPRFSRSPRHESLP